MVRVLFLSMIIILGCRSKHNTDGPNRSSVLNETKSNMSEAALSQLKSIKKVSIEDLKVADIGDSLVFF